MGASDVADLAVLIVGRNERFYAHTVRDVVAHCQGDTEIVAVLDGPPDPSFEPIDPFPTLRVIRNEAPIGQRQSINLAARSTTAPYLMKLDAHCSVDNGFDVKLLQPYRDGELDQRTTTIPRMYNLHVIDWVCDLCGHRRYQGPTPESCLNTGCPSKAFHREVIWQPRLHKLTDFARFDPDLHFQYFYSYKHRPAAQGDLVDVMCCVGAGWMLPHTFYDEIGGMDEAHGSWGQMGVELACKSWLSGGRQVVNKRTWFAHCFRTQGGDWSFPYQIHGSDIDKARAYSKAMWLGNRWPQQVRPLSWLLEKFWPVPGWFDPEGATQLKIVRDAGAAFWATHPQLPDAPKPVPSADLPEIPAPRGDQTPQGGVVYYTDSRLDPMIKTACQRQLRRACDGMPIAAVSLQPEDFGDYRIVLPLERGILTMFTQILAGLETLEMCEYVYFAEHDLLYHGQHFQFSPELQHAYYYNVATWKVNAETGHALFYRCKQTSGLCANRRLLIDHYKARIARVETKGRYERNMGFEPGCHGLPKGVDNYPALEWRADVPNIDIRHTTNLTPNRWSRDQFRNQNSCTEWTESDRVPGWGRTEGRFADFLREVTP